MRIVFLLAGAGLAAGGGFVAWLNRALAPRLLSPGAVSAEAGPEIWLLIGSLGAVVVGLAMIAIVMLTGGAGTGIRARSRAAEARRVREAVRAADAFYAERGRAANSGWRSSPLPAGPAPLATPSPIDSIEAPEPDESAGPTRFIEPPPAPAATPTLAAPPPIAPPQPDAPTRTAVVAPAAAPITANTVLGQMGRPFVSDVTLNRLPHPVDPPPASIGAIPVAPHVAVTVLSPGHVADVRSTPQQLPAQPPPAQPPPAPLASAPPAPVPPASASPATAETSLARAVAHPATAVAASPARNGGTPPVTLAFPEIRAAIRDMRLDEADQLMAEERARLARAGLEARPALAELTGLAGDHAEAAGRPGNARWLWRLALKRFSDCGASQSAEARLIADKLARTEED